MLKAVELTCEYLKNPIGIGEMNPRFAWIIESDLQNPEDVRELAAKCKNAAENWAGVADELWGCSGHCQGCKNHQSA